MSIVTAIGYFIPIIYVHKYSVAIIFIGEKIMVNQLPPGQRPNPLSQWYRQPKIYIKLPSGGQYYAAGSLDVSANGEYPVFSMTAKDELMFKTPDALLNGQSTVDVIKSCIPAIVDPWKMPSLDVDAALIAIRIATYGEHMDIRADCPSCGEENAYAIPLTDWLGSVTNFKYVSELTVGDLVVHVRPYSYKEITKSSLQAFEQQRSISIINDEKLTDEEKIEKFGESFSRLTALTVDIIAGCIHRIDTPDGSTDDPQHILDFIHNAPKDVFEAVSAHVQGMKSKLEMPNQKAECNECHFKFEIPITMDQSNFFAVRS
jgi:hypothetical protein